MRGGVRRGGRGRGGGGGGGYGRRDARPGGAASRDDRDWCDRRPDYSPRPRRRPSPGRRARRPRAGPRAEDDDGRDASRGNRGPTRGRYGGDRDRDRRPPGDRMDCSGDRDPSPGRRGDSGYGGNPRDASGRGRREDYDSRDLPRHGRREDERAAPYRQERDRYNRGPSGGYEAPPDYMLPDHPSDLGRPSLRGERRESDYFVGCPGDRSLINRDSGRNIGKERELFGDEGLTFRVSATELGRTSALYPDSRSPLMRAALSPPPPRYPSVPPTENGFLSERSAMKAGDDFGTGSTRFVQDDGEFKYGEHLRDPYVERSRGTERHYSGRRDVFIEKDGGAADRLYPAGDVPIPRDSETDRLYTSRGMPGSNLVPSTDPKLIGDSSSSLLAKDRLPYRMHNELEYEPSNGYAMDGLGMPSHNSLGHGIGRASRFSASSFERGSGHGDEALLDFTRQEHSNLAPRAASVEYDGHEYVARDPLNDTYFGSENLRGNVSQNSRHISGSASLTGLKEEGIDHHPRLSHRTAEDEDSYPAMLHNTEHNLPHSDGVDASLHYPPARVGNDRYSHSPGTEPIGIVRRPAHQHEFASFEDGRDFSDLEAPMVSRKRYRSPAYHDREMDMRQADDGYSDDDIDAYDLSPRRLPRIYDMVDEDGYDARYAMANNRDVFSRLALPHETSEEWTYGELENHPHLNTIGYGRSNQKPISQRFSRPIAHSQFEGSSMHGRGRGGLTKSGKKSMRSALHQFHGGYTSPRTVVRPNKFSKSSEEDPSESEMNHEGAPECEDPPVQKDPPEGSEEFSKQVHQAFLKYAKILNESPAMQKKFCDAPKGSLSCCVCGSEARKFPDLDALLSHAYDTCKAGLKTKHLGFHKALCVLMGWNWQVAPDTSKTHHSIPAEEVNAMREDLMLWPPVVVIRNSSIANKVKDTEAKIVSKEEIEGVLADIGIPREKAKVSHGRPANQSVFLVKFQPTISGFQEATRIHDHFSTRNHGKEEFQQMRDGKGKQVAPIDNLDELLYAHIAVAEDLVYLDEGTKRRFVIRSKMDIEATADATLNLEP